MLRGRAHERLVQGRFVPEAGDAPSSARKKAVQRQRAVHQPRSPRANDKFFIVAIRYTRYSFSRTTSSSPIKSHSIRIGGRGLVQPSLCGRLRAAKTLIR